MSYTLPQVPDLLAKIRERAVETFVQAKQRAVRHVYLEVQHDAPKLTGRARASLLLGINGPPSDEPPEADQPFYPLKGDEYLDPLLSQMSKPEDSAEIVGATPYWHLLADGWSSQAPAGWIDASVANGLQSAKEAAKR